MQGQSCKPQCVLDGIVLGSSYAQYRQLVRAQVPLLCALLMVDPSYCSHLNPKEGSVKSTHSMWQVDRAQQSIIAPLAARLQLLLPGRHLILADASGYGISAAQEQSPRSIAASASQTAGPLSVSGCARALSRTQAFLKETVGQLQAVQALQTAGSALAASIGGFRLHTVRTTAQSVLNSTFRRFRIRLWA